MIVENIFLWAQIFGILGMICSLAAWQLKNPQHIMLIYVPSGLCWAAQYYLLGALSAAFVLIFSSLKDLFVALCPNKFVVYAILTYLAIITVIIFHQYNIWLDTLPLIAMIILNLPRIQRENRPLIVRSFLLSQILWFVYNIQVGAVIGILCSVIITSSAFIGMVRHEKWTLGCCYRTFIPSLLRSLFTFPMPRTFP